MLENMTEKVIHFFKVLYSGITGGLSKVPRLIKKPEFRKSIYKFLFVLISLLGLVLFIVWLILKLVGWVAELVNYYSVYIVGIIIVILLVYNWREDKKKEAAKRRQEELQKQAKQARTQYNYLKNFLYINVLLSKKYC